MKRRSRRAIWLLLLMLVPGLTAGVLGWTASHHQAAREALRRRDYAAARQELGPSLRFWVWSGEPHLLAARAARGMAGVRRGRAAPAPQPRPRRGRGGHRTRAPPGARPAGRRGLGRGGAAAADRGEPRIRPPGHGDPGPALLPDLSAPQGAPGLADVAGRGAGLGAGLAPAGPDVGAERQHAGGPELLPPGAGAGPGPGPHPPPAGRAAHEGRPPGSRSRTWSASTAGWGTRRRCCAALPPAGTT